MARFGRSSIRHMTLSKFIKSNYNNWSILVKALLEAQDVRDIIKKIYVELEKPSTLTVPQMKALKGKRVANRIVFYILYQGVDKAEFEKVAGAITSKETWRILQTTYKGSSSQ
jgi:Domain of unknown function (DUF4219)